MVMQQIQAPNERHGVREREREDSVHASVDSGTHAHLLT
jgi:hypothetical protein